MSRFDLRKDYYEILGAAEGASLRDLEQLYKRRAAQCHPDKGGTEEAMKSLNEAYGVLRDTDARREYDSQRAKPETTFIPVTAPTADDVGLLGKGLTSFLCLLIGLFLLVLVRSQWIWFLWPLAILAVCVIMFGVMMARSTMRAMTAVLPASIQFRYQAQLRELIFWSVVFLSGYGLYLLLTSL